MLLRATWSGPRALAGAFRVGLESALDESSEVRSPLPRVDISAVACLLLGITPPG